MAELFEPGFEGRVTDFDGVLFTIVESMSNKKARSDLYANIQKRANKRDALVKCISKIDTRTPQTISDIRFYIDKIKEFRVDLDDFNSDVDDLLIKYKVLSDDQHGENTDIQEIYTDALGKVVFSLKFQLETIANEIPLRESDNSVKPNLKLPNVELPMFNSKPEEFEQFKFAFISIISKFNLTEFERYSYLRQQVKGDAKNIVDSIPIGQNEFTNAIQLLNDAFADTNVQVFSVIKNLVNLRVDTEDDSFCWISKARSIRDQIQRMKITEDDFLKYFLWQGMSPIYKKQFTAITNKNVPSVDEIMSGAFDVFKRISSNNNSPDMIPRDMETVRQPVVALATNVNYNHTPTKDSRPPSKPKNVCSLCTSDNKIPDHKLSNCPIYKSPHEKVTKLRKLKGCCKCGWTNHETKNCKFKLTSKCRKCDRYHFSFLCTSQADNSSSNLNCNNVSFNVMTAYSDSNIVIPSFTASARYRTNKKKHARCMYDPASQVSFVTDKYASKIKHKIVRQFNAKITGFNGPKSYDTNQIQFSITFGSITKEINALIVPEIKTKVSSPLFSTITDKFKKANVNLADKNLGRDEEVDILLGADYVDIIPVHSCCFGPLGKRSLVYYCAAGVMLAGDLNVLCENLEHLGLLKQFIRKIDTM